MCGRRNKPSKKNNTRQLPRPVHTQHGGWLLCRHGQTQNKATLAARVVVQADPDMADDRHTIPEDSDIALPLTGKRGRGTGRPRRQTLEGRGDRAAQAGAAPRQLYTRSRLAVMVPPPSPRGNSMEAQAHALSPSLSERSNASREGSPQPNTMGGGDYVSEDTPDSTGSNAQREQQAAEASWKHNQRNTKKSDGSPLGQTLLSAAFCRVSQAPVRLDPASPCMFLFASCLPHLPTQHHNLAECVCVSVGCFD